MMPYTRRFVPPSLADTMPWLAWRPLPSTLPDCAVACVDGSMLRIANGVHDRCVACLDLPIPDHAPYHHYASRWDLEPGVRWWPPAFDPPHLPLRLSPLASEPRAGLCWPCPLVWEADALLFQYCAGLNTTTTRGRRLLQTTTATAAEAVCPPGTFVAKGHDCTSMRARSWCVPCPRNTRCTRYGPVPCGPNEMSAPRSTRRECVPGFQRDQQTCLPALPPPLPETLDICPKEDQILTQPFLPSSSATCAPCPPWSRKTRTGHCRVFHDGRHPNDTTILMPRKKILP